jgi:hypothetical protein
MHSAEQTNGLTDEQVEQLLSAAGRRKDDPGYIERLVEGAAEYRRLLQDQEAKALERIDK